MKTDSPQSTRASCKHLTYKYPAYSGCTLEEAAVIAGVLLSICALIAIVIGIYCHWVGAFFLAMIGLFLLVFMKKSLYSQLLVKFGKMKEDRPQGYLWLKIRRTLHEKLKVKTPFLMRSGHWCLRRSQK